jgi:hypothetical protein
VGLESSAVTTTLTVRSEPRTRFGFFDDLLDCPHRYSAQVAHALALRPTPFQETNALPTRTVSLEILCFLTVPSLSAMSAFSSTTAQMAKFAMGTYALPNEKRKKLESSDW